MVAGLDEAQCGLVRHEIFFFWFAAAHASPFGYMVYGRVHDHVPRGAVDPGSDLEFSDK
jgi:hypothetical protein